jgi:hypothetical protein
MQQFAAIRAVWLVKLPFKPPLARQKWRMPEAIDAQRKYA